MKKEIIEYDKSLFDKSLIIILKKCILNFTCLSVTGLRIIQNIKAFIITINLLCSIQVLPKFDQEIQSSDDRHSEDEKIAVEEGIVKHFLS